MVFTRINVLLRLLIFGFLTTFQNISSLSYLDIRGLCLFKGPRLLFFPKCSRTYVCLLFHPLSLLDSRVMAGVSSLANTISTKGDSYVLLITTGTLGFSDLPTALNGRDANDAIVFFFIINQSFYLNFRSNWLVR